MEKPNILNNVFWKFAERFGVQFFTFAISIVLARILDPEAYGKVAIVTVFTGILGVLCDSGLGNALIQKADADDTDFSTVFYVNVLVSASFCLLLFLTAPLIASYYNDPELIPLIRVLSFSVPLFGVRNIQQAYVSKNMLFKKFFFSTLSGTLVSAAVGVAVALKGGGPWALVFMQLSLQLVDTVVLWFTVPWRPKAEFSFSSLKTLFSFGGRILASAMLETIYSNLRALIIGKAYNAEALAFYTKGKGLPDTITVNINSSIESVMFPVLSMEQNNANNLKVLTKKTIRVSTFALFPCLIGLMAVAETLIITMIGEKWAEAIPFMRLFCAYSLLFPFHTANLNAIKALGRADIILKQELIKKIVGLTLLIISIPFGVLAIALSLVAEGVLAQIINTVPNQKLIGYGYLDQLKDVAPCFFITSVMGIVVYLGNYLPLINPIKLVIQITMGAIIYIVGSRIAVRDLYDYYLGIIIKVTGGRKNR